MWLLSLRCFLQVVCLHLMFRPLFSLQAISDNGKYNVAWCISGQVGRFVFHEQVDFSKLLNTKQVQVDVYIVLEDNDPSTTVASHGAIAPIPYLKDARDEKAVSNYFKERGATTVLHKLIDPKDSSELLQKLSEKFITKISPGIHALTHEFTKDRWNRAGNMFYLRHLAFAYAAAASASRNYKYYMILREDNVFLAPFVQLANLFGEINPEKSSYANSTGGDVAVDIHCDLWGGYSDKIYAVNFKGGSSIFGATSQAFEDFIESWLRHGILCLKQMNKIYPDMEQYSYMMYLEKNGVQAIEHGTKQAMKHRQLYAALNDTRLPLNASFYPLKDNQSLQGEGNGRNGDEDERRKLKKCGWVAHRRQFLCEEEESHVDEWGHVWNSGDVKPKNQPAQSKGASVALTTKQTPSSSSRTTTAPGAQSTKTRKQNSAPSKTKASTHVSAAWKFNPQRIYGHIPMKNGEPRCNRFEPLQPETFLQDFMDKKKVTIHPLDFQRTEVRFVNGKSRPCVRDIYYPCAPTLEKSHAFAACK